MAIPNYGIYTRTVVRRAPLVKWEEFI
jgi:hypothetical protein